MVYDTLRLKTFNVKIFIFSKKLWEREYLVARFLFFEKNLQKSSCFGLV